MAEVKEQILLCARDIFLDEGMSHFSMRKVAQCVGVSATALYRHFANKEELLFHVLVRGFQIFADYLQQVDEELPPLEGLLATVEAYLDFALSEQPYYELMFISSEQMTGLVRLNREGAEAMQQTFKILQQRVQALIDQGVSEASDAYLSAYAIWSFAHGQLALFMGGKTGMTRKEFVGVYRVLMSDYIRKL